MKMKLSDSFNYHGKVDFIDMQLIPNGNYKWILHYQDHTTKFSFLRPLTSKRKEEVAFELLKLFLEFGFPASLQSEKDGEFLSAVTNELFEVWPNCKIINKNSVIHESIDPDVENMLQAWMQNNNSTNWVIGIHFVQYQKNCTFYQTIQKTPYNALFGIDPTVEFKLELSVDFLSKLHLHEGMKNGNCDITDQSKYLLLKSESYEQQDLVLRSIKKEPVQLESEECVIYDVQQDLSEFHSVKMEQVPPEIQEPVSCEEQESITAPAGSHNVKTEPMEYQSPLADSLAVQAEDCSIETEPEDFQILQINIHTKKHTHNQLITSAAYDLQYKNDIPSRDAFNEALAPMMNYYSPRSRNALWTKKRIYKAIRSIGELKRIRITKAYRYYARHYEVCSISGQKTLIVKRRSTTEPKVKIIPSDEFYDILSDIHYETNHGGRNTMHAIIKNKYNIPIAVVNAFHRLCKSVKCRNIGPRRRGNLQENRIAPPPTLESIDKNAIKRTYARIKK
ncbi:KRAB-A domain-containing protein 2-like [Pectinophora gossypiella]|uniref:Integrase catalytic domain-containing protein n=1 Tax=Pectinophora gossypiella TaxID=13191 RepID=A0A1E1WGC2_PECGO|nr:KRAB-A domain-containing protein 2-like [Pectinophora gossypiella]XP_049885724.1 KRAB-A domain-containing protein 2-like [Pectinophora gossypiella]